MSFTYQFEEEEKIIYLTFKGECNLEEIKESVHQITGDPNYKPHFHILTDIRNGRLAFQPNALTELAQLFEERFGGSTGKSAMLLSSPRETAMAMLHQKKVSRTIELFSTREAALIWLKSDD